MSVTSVIQTFGTIPNPGELQSFSPLNPKQMITLAHVKYDVAE